MANRLKAEIQQTRPFLSAGEEAFLNLQRTAGLQFQSLARFLKPFDLTPTQYNVLRILRGALPGSLPSGEVGTRMVTPEPDVTRLLDRLESRGLIRRSRENTDRRVVRARLEGAGLELLARLDEPIHEFLSALTSPLDGAQQSQLIELLERLRTGD
ncbi:MAG TPA: MarR family transcriptional regulator [Thermoanaerobaculia bacterium]|nr:MarR family transcriptional regulator [Thermoanaerobaculia bacterium]